MKKVKIISLIIAAAMLSAGAYAADIVDIEEAVPAEEPVDVVYAVTTTAVPEEQTGVEIDIAYEEPFDADYGEDEDMLPEEELPPDEVDNVEAFPELGDIEKYLAMNGYPAYLSFICNTAAAINGYDPSSGEEYRPQMTYWWDVGVVNATAVQKAEIKALIDELYPIENIVTFVNCTYSYAERKALIPEIRQTVEEMFPTVKVIDVSLIRNTEQIALHLDFSADGDVVEPDMVKEKMYAVYGDLLYMGDFGEITTDDFDGALPTVGIAEFGAGEEIDVEEEIDEAVGQEGMAVGSNADIDTAPAIGGEIAAVVPTEQSNDNTLLWICIAAALVIALGAVAFIYRAKLIPVFATSHGDVTAEKMNKKQTENAVKNCEVVPDDSVLQAIKEKIEK